MYAIQGLSELSTRLRDLTGREIIDMNRVMELVQFAYQQQQLAFHGLMIVFAAATALVFFLLLFIYESFRLAIAILVTSLLAPYSRVDPESTARLPTTNQVAPPCWKSVSARVTVPRRKQVS